MTRQWPMLTGPAWSTGVLASKVLLWEAGRFSDETVRKAPFQQAWMKTLRKQVPLILIDKPYVSEFLKSTIERNALPVVMTETARQFGLADGPHLLEETDAVQQARDATDLTVYTTSENAIGWINENLSFTDLPDKIDCFKNKARFRSILKPINPGFFIGKLTWINLMPYQLIACQCPSSSNPTLAFSAWAFTR